MSKGSEKSSGKKKNPQLPPEIEDKFKNVTIGIIAPTNTATMEHHSVFSPLGFDNSFDLEEFKKNFKIKIISYDENELVFDLIGVDAAVANAFRRILIAEVPSVAIETVYIRDNTSMIQDEVLAHRLGLIPIKADPRKFEPIVNPNEYTDTNTLVFNLTVTCEHNPDGKDSENEDEKYINSKVYSHHLEWNPQGQQQQQMADVRPVFEDILIAKLRPGQTIDVVCYCQKGVGKDHAKYSPVSTAAYRLLPKIEFLEEITGAKAKELVDICPMKVYDIEDLGGVKKARVANPRNCTMCRECIREPENQQKIKLSRQKDHFIFSIESVGILAPEILFEEAVKVLLEKITKIQTELAKLQQTVEDRE
jgi:DNA-directed RNA polymerase I and III subunit RPAC1